jgi:hypothetical protein
MSTKITALDLVVDLSVEEQQLLSGGQDTPGGVPADLEDEPDTREPFEEDVPFPDEREERPRRTRTR